VVNRRRHKRFIKYCDTEFVSNGMIYTGTSSNFSLHGMFIRTDHPQAPDTILDMALYLPYGAISKVSVKVKRACASPAGTALRTGKKEKIGMGVELIERDSNYVHFIRYLLNRASLEQSLSSSIGMNDDFTPVEVKDMSKRTG